MHPISLKFDAVITSSASYWQMTVAFQVSLLNFGSVVKMVSFQVYAASQEKQL